MSQNSFAALRRRARSVLIVTDLPVRLQGKKKHRKRHEPGTRIVRLGDVVVLLSLSATGVVTFEVEPP